MTAIFVIPLLSTKCSTLL